MDAFIPVSGGAADAALVQANDYPLGPGAAVSQSIPFPSPVTAGNLLIVCIVTRSYSGPFPTPSGWTKQDEVNANGFNSGDGAIFSKIAVGTEGAGTTFDTGAGTERRIMVAEFSGPTTLSDSNGTDGGGASSSYNIGSVTPDGGTSTLLVALALNSDAISSITSYTNAAGPDTVGGGINGPHSILAYRIVNPASGSYAATVNQTAQDICGGAHLAFSGAAGGVVWSPAPDTVDDDEGTEDAVTAVSMAAAGDAFWRADLGSAQAIGQIEALIGFDDAGSVTVAVQAGDAADWSDAATIVEIEHNATGGFTADLLSMTWDPTDSHRYWRLTLETTAQDIEVVEIGLAEADIFEPSGPSRAILEIYVHDEDASRWGTATWATGPATGTEGIWSAAGWQDVTPEGVNAHIIWGSRQSARGILAQQNAASWNVQTYDPDRILDPGNFDSPYYPQLVAGVPIRISHDSLVIRTGYIDEFHYKHKSPDYQGQFLCTDTWSLLNQAMVPADSVLGNTLLSRISDAVNAAGIAVGGIPIPPTAPTGPTIANWVEGAALDDPTSVGEHVRIATSEVLWVPYIQADASLAFRAWGTPLDRGREITAPNLEDLESVSSEDGLYSVVRVQVENPALDPIEREAAPLPRYGRRLWERTEPTVDPEGYADAILAERPWPGVQYIPGAIHCFTAADVDYFGSLEIMERVTIVLPGAVSVSGRILGGELFVEHRARDTKGAKWIFNFAVATDGATAIGLTTLVSDQAGDTLLDDAAGTEYLEAD